MLRFGRQIKSTWYYFYLFFLYKSFRLYFWEFFYKLISYFSLIKFELIECHAKFHHSHCGHGQRREIVCLSRRSHNYFSGTLLIHSFFNIHFSGTLYKSFKYKFVVLSGNYASTNWFWMIYEKDWEWIWECDVKLWGRWKSLCKLVCKVGWVLQHWCSMDHVPTIWCPSTNGTFYYLCGSHFLFFFLNG